jgi:15-cis-phytoene synthase
MSAHTYLQSHEVCELITRRHAKSFFFASRVLPLKKRQAAYALYAFCRLADDGIDLATTPGEMQGHLSRCHELLNRVYSHDQTVLTHPIEPAFQQAVARYGIPKKLFEDLMTGLVLDSHFQQPKTETELIQYCYYVAGCVGLIMTHVFGAASEAHQYAVSLGNAMQLTNIARDIKEDAGRGRIYLPAGWLEEAGISPIEFATIGGNGEPSAEVVTRIRELQERLVLLAEGLYAEAWKGVPLLTADGSRFCVALMAVTYGGILKKIKKRGPSSLLSRQSLSFFEKLWLVPRAIGAQNHGLPADGVHG